MQRFTYRVHVGPTAVEQTAAQLDATGRLAKRVMRGTEHVHVSIDTMTQDAAYLDMLTTFEVAGLYRPRLQFLHARDPEA